MADSVAEVNVLIAAKIDGLMQGLRTAKRGLSSFHREQRKAAELTAKHDPGKQHAMRMAKARDMLAKGLISKDTFDAEKMASYEAIKKQTEVIEDNTEALARQKEQLRDTARAQQLLAKTDDPGQAHRRRMAEAKDLASKGAMKPAELSRIRAASYAQLQQETAALEKNTEAARKDARAKQRALAIIQQTRTPQMIFNDGLKEAAELHKQGELSTIQVIRRQQQLREGLDVYSGVEKRANRTSYAIGQLAVAFEDGASVWGTMGFGGAMRAASNNLSQFVTVMNYGKTGLHAMLGPAVGIAAVFAGAAIPAMIKWMTNTRDAGEVAEQTAKKLDRLRDSIENQFKAASGKLELEISLRTIGRMDTVNQAEQAIESVSDDLKKLDAERKKTEQAILDMQGMRTGGLVHGGDLARTERKIDSLTFLDAQGNVDPTINAKLKQKVRDLIGDLSDAAEAGMLTEGMESTQDAMNTILDDAVKQSQEYQDIMTQPMDPRGGIMVRDAMIRSISPSSPIQEDVSEDTISRYENDAVELAEEKSRLQDDINNKKKEEAALQNKLVELEKQRAKIAGEAARKDIEKSNAEVRESAFVSTLTDKEKELFELQKARAEAIKKAFSGPWGLGPGALLAMNSITAADDAKLKALRDKGRKELDDMRAADGKDMPELMQGAGTDKAAILWSNAIKQQFDTSNNTESQERAAREQEMVDYLSGINDILSGQDAITFVNTP